MYKHKYTRNKSLRQINIIDKKPEHTANRPGDLRLARTSHQHRASFCGQCVSESARIAKRAPISKHARVNQNILILPHGFPNSYVYFDRTCISTQCNSSKPDTLTNLRPAG